MVDVATRPVRAPAFRLRRRARRTILLAHIAAAGAWLGIDVVLGVMVGTALVTGDAQQAGVALQSLGLFAVWPLVVVGLLCLASGILLGVGSTYGLVRYWWVAVKLALTLVLCTLIVVLLRPGLAELAAYGREVAAGTAAERDLRDLFFPPAVSLTALTLATVLSVAKPWGRTRRVS